MKKTIIVTGLVVVGLFAALFAFNKISDIKKKAALFTEVSEGKFEIAVSTTGELLALKSVDIMGPNFTEGRDIRMVNIKITDMITEGTEVKRVTTLQGSTGLSLRTLLRMRETGIIPI